MYYCMQTKIKLQEKTDKTLPYDETIVQTKLASSALINIEASTNTARKVKLPMFEAQLLNGLDSYNAHTDEIADPSASEISVYGAI